MIEKLNRKVKIIQTAAPVKDEYGGLTEGAATEYEMWAEVKDRSGFPVLNEQQHIWNYDVRVKVRYEASRLIKSNYYVQYEGANYSIKEVVAENEGKKRFVILRCQKTDEAITTS